MQLKKKKWALLVFFGVTFLLLSGCNGGSITPEPIPSAPSNLTATANSSTQVELSWQDNSNNEKRFYIYRKSLTSSTVSDSLTNSEYSQIGYVGANSNGAYDTELSPATTYSYKVTAWNNSGESDFSNEATITTPAEQTIPNAPSNLAATVMGCYQIDLNWQDNSDNEDGFKVFRLSGASTTYSEVADLPANSTFYSNLGLYADWVYSYYIQAYNSAGSSTSNSASATTLPFVEILNHQLGEKYGDAYVTGQGRNNLNQMIDWIEITVWWYDSSGVLLRTDWGLINDVPGLTTFNFEVWGYNIPRNQVAWYDIEVTDVTIY